MFINLNHHFNGVHMLVDGKEERYAYVSDEMDIGNIHVIVHEDSLYIDFLEIKEPYRKKGLGTKVIQEMFTYFTNINRLWGLCEEDLLDGFWSKQQGFRFVGEQNDEYEGYFIFELNKMT